MTPLHFRVWYRKEQKMYYRGYQKWTHVLLCEDDGRKGGEGGRPVMRASYDDCEMMQSSGICDKRGVEIYEGDLVRIKTGNREVEGVVGSIPDMLQSRKLHPLYTLLEKGGFSGEEPGLVFEVLGNQYEMTGLNFLS